MFLFILLSFITNACRGASVDVFGGPGLRDLMLESCTMNDLDLTFENASFDFQSRRSKLDNSKLKNEIRQVGAEAWRLKAEVGVCTGA